MGVVKVEVPLPSMQSAYEMSPKLKLWAFRFTLAFYIREAHPVSC
jgi:hypothetical protein